MAAFRQAHFGAAQCNATTAIFIGMMCFKGIWYVWILECELGFVHHVLSVWNIGMVVLGVRMEDLVGAYGSFGRCVWRFWYVCMMIFGVRMDG